MSWPAVIKELIALLKKFGGAFFAFMAGRSSVERKHEKREHKVAENELEAEREAADIMADPAALERLRERWKDTE